MHHLLRSIVLLALALPVTAQRKSPDAVRLDPFSKGDALVMLKAGYVSFGPFEFGDDHDTAQIEQILGDVKIAWIETRHFKIGCSLAPLPMPDGIEGNRVEQELVELGKSLPRVDPKTRVLSTWLRAHLFAQRVEQVYASLQKRLGVKDDDFPDEPGAVSLKHYMGEGPYLGQRGKYLLLLFDRASSFGRYTRAFLSSKQRFAMRHMFKKTDSLLFATSEEFAAMRFRDDTAMHCHVVFSVVHNLIDGYRHYGHDIPVWFKEGLAQWHLRQIDPRFTNYDTLDELTVDMRAVERWEPHVLALARAKSFTPAEVVLHWRDYERMKFQDRMAVWSRVDWLLTLGDEKLRVFVNRMKDPFHDKARFPSATELFARQDEALKKAWDLDIESFDARWSAWVIKAYADR